MAALNSGGAAIGHSMLLEDQFDRELDLARRG
jgi:hypothetical protein